MNEMTQSNNSNGISYSHHPRNKLINRKFAVAELKFLQQIVWPSFFGDKLFVLWCKFNLEFQWDTFLFNYCHIFAIVQGREGGYSCDVTTFSYSAAEIVKLRMFVKN